LQLVTVAADSKAVAYMRNLTRLDIAAYLACAEGAFKVSGGGARMGLAWHGMKDLTIEDERSLSHVEIYDQLKQRMLAADVRFGVLEGERVDHALVLNLAFWRPGEVAEVLSDDVITADQLAHNAWHWLAAEALEDDGRSTEGLLLAESIASAFDIYLVGRLIGHAPDSQFLGTQVPAMADAALDAGLSDAAFEALLERASQEPEKSFEELRQLLYDVSVGLLACEDIESAAGVLAGAEGHPWASLLHHYELSTWVLFARCYGREGGASASSVDAALRAAPDSIEWLQASWLSQ
jgi:hypothetical protein